MLFLIKILKLRLLLPHQQGSFQLLLLFVELFLRHAIETQLLLSFFLVLFVHLERLAYFLLESDHAIFATILHRVRIDPWGFIISILSKLLFDDVILLEILLFRTFVFHF